MLKKTLHYAVGAKKKHMYFSSTSIWNLIGQPLPEILHVWKDTSMHRIIPQANGSLRVSTNYVFFFAVSSNDNCVLFYSQVVYAFKTVVR